MGAHLCGFCNSEPCECGKHNPFSKRERIISMSSTMVLLDVWGGHENQEHVARFIGTMDAAFLQARREIMAGFLVNIRQDVVWGPEYSFDNRVTN